MDEQETSRFLLAHDEEKPDQFQNTRNKQSRVNIRGLKLHLCFIFSYTLIFFITSAITLRKLNHCQRDLIYTPAREAVTWTKQTVYNPLGLKTKYNGPPSPEIDEAWGKLIQHSNIKVSGDELQKTNKSSIQLQDGSGMYFSNLGVHHHLHCLKIARQMIYREHYQIADEPGTWTHLDHCLEDLRLVLMCKADTSLITYDWLPNFPHPWARWKIDKECVDWDKLDSWAAERSFSVFDQKSLVHPELGVSFPVKQESEIGVEVLHARPEDIDTVAEGTNPKGNWGP